MPIECKPFMNVAKRNEATIEPLVRLLAPLTAEHVAPWRPDPDRQDTIIGEWAEDGSHYTLVVPTQLRPAIVAMQNALPRLLANDQVEFQEGREAE